MSPERSSFCHRIRVPDSAVDVWRFEKAREISRAAGDKAAELAALEDALGLWQGEALAGVPGLSPHTGQ